MPPAGIYCMIRHIFCFLLLAAALPCLFAMRAQAAESAQTRYLRAVYVLRTLAPSLSTGSLAFPRRIITDDTTNTLVQHPDKIFVLSTLARELEELTQQKKSLTDAAYYSANAYYTLGRRADAARLMSRYILTAPYRPEDHLFLVRCLYENGDYQAARTAATQWRVQNPRCDEQRLTYVWGSFRAENRTRDALDALEDSACAGWQPKVLAARSTLDAGDAEGAERAVKILARRYPKNAKAIHALWEQLREAERYP